MNWEILTKNLVTFNRWDRVKDVKSEYFVWVWVSMKNPIFRGEVVTKNRYREELPKKGPGQFADLRDYLAKNCLRG